VRALARAYDRLIDAAAAVAGIGIAFIALGVTADVAVRYFAGGAIKWMLESSEYVLFGIAFLGAPWALREGAHTAVDLLAETLPDAAKRYCALAANGVGFATSAGLLWFGGIAAMQSRSLGTMIYKTVVLPEWWILVLIPFCGALLVIEFGRKIRATLRGEPPPIAPRQGTV